ncbi:hypothetical protein [Mesorhizobium ciceri]|uniref:hypothetical protein n=1 Tax=Mesorhizobium ciceri TaxID=39645 RepID=UPI00047BF35D|nr:hypothetical protein [Mesorhizobium ciceri]
MTLSVKHKFQSAIPDAGDPNIVQPSNWNDEHALTQATATILGRVSALTGDTEELTPAQARTLLNVADGATSNSTDAFLLARANHTGTQLAATISNFSTAASLVCLPLAGGTMTGKLNTLATAAVAGAGLNIPHGVAPTTPVDGDIWSTSAFGIYARVNGVTKAMVSLDNASQWTIIQNFKTSSTTAASIRMPHGVAPSSPTNGDMWTTTAGLLYRINGVTVTAMTTTDAVATFSTQVTSPKVIGGTGVGSSLSLQSTSGVGATDFINFLVGNAGATEAARFDTSARFLMGATASVAMNIIGTHPRLQVHGVNTDTTTIAQTRWETNSVGVQHYLNHSRGAAVGTHALLADGDGIGSWISGASDGVKFIDGTSIQAVADGAQALDSTPSAINFRTNSGTTATSIKGRLTALGQWLFGHVTSIAVGATSNQVPTLQVHGLSTDAQATVYRWAASTGGATLGLFKSRGAAAGTRAIVASGDTIGALQAFADDGTNSPAAARIQFVVDGTPGLADMPGRIELATTPDGASTVTTRAVIDCRGFTSLSGSFGRGAPVTKNADFTLADTENSIIVTKGSSCVVTLPSASLWVGREVTIKTTVAFTTVSASSNVVPAAGGAAGTAILAAVAGSKADLISDGTNWIIF